MRSRTVNINADLGEGAGNDEAIMPYLHSCNIACGGHAGDEKTIRQTIRLALKHGVKIGAHPGYPDKEHFGRVALKLSEKELIESLDKQLKLFDFLCKEEGGEIHHIKLHGALYNETAKNTSVSKTVLSALKAKKVANKLYVPHGSVIHRQATPHFDLVFEAFIDRAYESDGHLRDRQKEGALFHTEESVWEQLWSILEDSSVKSYSGEKIDITATTFCIHGDHPKAVNILKFLREKLEDE